MSLADDFEKRLRTYDPQLRLRWGSAVKAWVIDREARMSKGERELIAAYATHYTASVEDVEKEKSAKLGRHMIGSAKTLDNKILDDLALRDLQRKGFGPSAQVNRVLKAQEQRVAASRVQGHEVARQTNDVLHWALKTQSAKIHAGRSDELIAEGFGWKVQKGQQFGPPRLGPVIDRNTDDLPPLYDPFNRPLVPSAKKVQLASK